MAKTDEFIYESLQDRQSIVKYLNALVDGFSSGKLLLGVKEQQMALEPQGLIRIEVEGEKKDDKMKLKLKFQWKENRVPSEYRDAAPLIISPDKAAS